MMGKDPLRPLESRIPLEGKWECKALVQHTQREAHTKAEVVWGKGRGLGSDGLGPNADPLTKAT